MRLLLMLIAALIMTGCHFFDFFKPHPDPFYAAVLKVDKKNPAALYSQGSRLLSKQRYADAEAYFDQLTQADPSDVAGWDALGHVYLEQNKFVDAQKAFEQELALKKNISGQIGLAD